MTDKDKLEKVRAEIERIWNKLKEEKLTFDNYATGSHSGKLELVCDLLSFIDSMQEEPVSKIWHDASELPKTESIIVINNDQTTLSVEYIGQSLSGVEQWAYLDDLLNIDNKFKEEPISEDMEKAAKVYEQTRNDLDVVSDNQMVERAFKAGAKWQKEQMIEEKASMSCVLEWYDGFVLNFTEEQLNDVVAKNNINIGDKVKVIVMKED